MNHGRLPWLEVDELDQAQRALYDAITSSQRARSRPGSALTDVRGRLEGPFNAMLFSPSVGNALQSLGDAVRFKTHLSARCRELAILEVARAEDSRYEWHVHRLAGRDAGLNEHELAAIKDGLDLPDLPREDQSVRRVVRQLALGDDLDDEAMAEGESVLGLAALTELVVLVGYYRLLALTLRVWRVPLPADAAPDGRSDWRDVVADSAPDGGR